MLTLNNGRLRVEIAEPGERPNDRTRFDRAGFIAEVVLDGEVRYAASEPDNLVHPSSGGRGFCNEFRFDVSMEAKVGEYFPKFGVGLIRREDEEKYSFFRTYLDVKEFPVEYVQTKDSVTFVTAPADCMGYALRSTKTVRIEENCMVMEVRVENSGEKEMTINEFCHNFISIDGMAVGSDYLLELPQVPDLGYGRLNNRRGFSSAMRGNGRGLTFCEFTAIDTDYAVQGSDMAQTVPFTWKMTHRGAKAGVKGEDDFVPKFLAVWGVDHMMCPEVVHEFTVKPGESHAWKRSWEFFQMQADCG